MKAKRTLSNRGRNRKSGFERPIYRSAVEMLIRLGYTFDGKVGWRAPADALKNPRILYSMVRMMASKLASVESAAGIIGESKHHDVRMREQIEDVKRTAIWVCNGGLSNGEK